MTQKDPGRLPVPVDGRFGDLQDPGRLFDRQPPEEPKLDDPSLAGIQPGELGQGFMQPQDIHSRLGPGDQEILVQSHCDASATTPVCVSTPGVVDENAAHHSRGETQKVRPRDEPIPALSGKTHVRLVNQGGRLQSVVASLTGQEAAGEPPKLVVHRGKNLGKRLPHFRAGIGKKGFHVPFGEVGQRAWSFLVPSVSRRLPDFYRVR